MVDLRLHDEQLAVAARTLAEAAVMPRAPHAQPMRGAASYTGIGGVVDGFMQTSGIAAEALSDALAAAATSAAAIMHESAATEAEIGRVLGADSLGAR